jgi:predicted GTPase
LVEWEAALQIECLDPVTGETVDDIDVSLRVNQQMAVVVDWLLRKKTKSKIKYTSLEMSCWKRLDEKNRTDGQRPWMDT